MLCALAAWMQSFLGVLPDSLGRLKALNLLYLGNNQLTGELSLEHTNRCGCIPCTQAVLAAL